MHKKWVPGTLYAKAMRDITNEHNATVDAWQAAEAEAERLGRANSDLCDQIEARAVGWELDVTAEEIYDAFHSGPADGWEQAVLTLCRARIKPVYECKECRQWRNANDELVRRATAARAALEGE